MNLTSFDSSLNVLSKVFWVQVDRMKRPAANSGGRVKMAPLSRGFREIADERFLRSQRTQNRSCKTGRELSIDSSFIRIRPQLRHLKSFKVMPWIKAADGTSIIRSIHRCRFISGLMNSFIAEKGANAAQAASLQPKARRMHLGAGMAKIPLGGKTTHALRRQFKSPRWDFGSISRRRW